ncbi:MAG: cyclodeaminase/cyclohydrolase family protein [Candidatus Heimdallarchaeaceae archaeon]
MSDEKILKNMTITEFLDELASSSPAPGGGSAACVAGAMGAALGSMVANLTIGKEKYQEVEELFTKAKEQTEKLRQELTDLIDKDANAFSGVIEAFKMPKDTEEQKKARSAKIQEEYKKAAMVPMETCRACRKVIDLLLETGTKGNKNAVSDIAVGALCALTGLKAASLNVEINLPAIKDEEFVASMKKELAELLEGVDEKVSKLIEEVRTLF